MEINYETIRSFALQLKGVSESFPFDEETLVFKVEGKMFLLMSLDAVEKFINVKCNPEEAIRLREHYEAVEPAFHCNKKYWNSIYLNRDLSKEAIEHWIMHSYEEVIAKLPLKIRKEYQPL